MIVNNQFDRMAKSALIARDGWKLVEVDREKDHFQLYNIIDDNEERQEVSKQFPDKVAQLKLILLRELDSDRPDL